MSKRIALCSIVLIGLISMATAPATQPDSADKLTAENRALRDALTELNVKNRALEQETARLRTQVKALEDRLAKVAVPQLPQTPQPFRFEMPNTVRPNPYAPNPVPKEWVPKKDGSVDFYVIPIHAEDGTR